MSHTATILIIDDQSSARMILSRLLADTGHTVHEAESVPEALGKMQSHVVDVVITDLRMPGVDGLEGLRRIRTLDANIPVILLTAHGTVETAVQAMKLGAFDYVRKPFDVDEMEIIVNRALAHRNLVEENKRLRAEVDARFGLESILGKSPPMVELFELLRKVGPSELPVLIAGESGSGKDLVARAIHGLSPRRSGTFLSINCAAVPETLLESELFGHERGAFSGAERARRGYFREADGGTLFLDEIGDMSLGQQAKLLRVLETGELIPVGSEQPVEVNVRLLGATNRDLDEMVAEGTFRSDLLFRIDAVRVSLPSLRSRREDLPILVAHFLERVGKATHRNAPRMGNAAMQCLYDYPWPGNVRELEHAIEHAALVSEGAEITPTDLPARVLSGKAASTDLSPDLSTMPYRDAKELFDKTYFLGALERAGGNVQEAARLAGIHRATFHTRLKKLRGDED